MDGVAQWHVGDTAPPPLPRRSEADVVARWQDGPPLVSVLCPTYQHVDFIEDALRGFLGQDTDFPFEVIVRDDASNDGTAEIVRSYAEQYPSIVRAILEPTNTFAQVVPLIHLASMAQGRIHATCEGDDYWCDSRKLARQSAELTASAKIFAVGHATLVASEDGRVLGAPPRAPLTKRRLVTARQLRAGSGDGLHTSAVVHRALEWPPRVTDVRIANFDILRNQWFGTCGDAVILEGLIGSVYRRHGEGWQTGATEDELRRRSIMSRYHIATAMRDLGANDAADASATAAALSLSTQLGVANARGVARLATGVLRLRVAERARLGSAYRPLNIALWIWRRIKRLTR